MTPKGFVTVSIVAVSAVAIAGLIAIGASWAFIKVVMYFQNKKAGTQG